MQGNLVSSESKWYTEPLRRIRNAVATVVVVAGAVVAAGNEVLDVAPAKYRDAVTTTVAIATFVSAVAIIVQGKLGRDGVPFTLFNGVTSPEHVHSAMVASASTDVPVAVPKAGTLAEYVTQNEV